jgi:hypothetical protein
MPWGLAHYSKGVVPAGTVMRYFLSLTGTKAPLTLGVAQPSAPGRSVAFRGTANRLAACLISATIEAVNMAAITTPTNEYLAVTSCAVVHPG